MDSFYSIIISGVISLTVAYFTAIYKTKGELEKDRAKLRDDVIMKQKHEYFLPFKYCADEFRRRLEHIVIRLENFDSEKHIRMIKRLNQNFECKELKWFFNDEISPNGGYFITSTIYQNCLLFYWMKRIQIEHPFIPLKMGENYEKTMHKYKEFIKDKEYLSPIEAHNCDIYDFIKNIKIIIALDKGIPYGLHDSFGDFLFDKSDKHLLNYEEFCKQLLDEEKIIKFYPILKFWKGIIIDDISIDEVRFLKIKGLKIILELLNFAEIRDSVQ